MKNTFLMNKIHEDGGAALCVVTAEEWLDAVKENRSLPPEQRRYFISDCIEEGDTIDRMIIEVPYSEYRRWNSRHTVSERSRGQKKSSSICLWMRQCRDRQRLHCPTVLRTAAAWKPPFWTRS